MKTARWGLRAIAAMAIALSWARDGEAGLQCMNLFSKNGPNNKLIGCKNLDCPPDMSCQIKDFTIIRRDNGEAETFRGCVCLPLIQGLPGGNDLIDRGSFSSLGTVAMSSGSLSFTGDTVTASSFSSDSIVGSAVTFSGNFNLVGTGTSDQGVSAALFAPSSPTSIDVGGLFSGTIDRVEYIQTDMESRFDVVVRDFVAGPEVASSPFARDLFAPDASAFGLSFSTDTPLFSEIVAGNFGPQVTTNFAISASVPEPSALLLTGIGTVILLGRSLFGRESSGASIGVRRRENSITPRS